MCVFAAITEKYKALRKLGKYILNNFGLPFNVGHEVLCLELSPAYAANWLAFLNNFKSGTSAKIAVKVCLPISRNGLQLS